MVEYVGKEIQILNIGDVVNLHEVNINSKIANTPCDDRKQTIASKESNQEEIVEETERTIEV